MVGNDVSRSIRKPVGYTRSDLVHFPRHRLAMLRNSQVQRRIGTVGITVFVSICMLLVADKRRFTSSEVLETHDKKQKTLPRNSTIPPTGANSLSYEYKRFTKENGTRQATEPTEATTLENAFGAFGKQTNSESTAAINKTEATKRSDSNITTPENRSDTIIDPSTPEDNSHVSEVKIVPLKLRVPLPEHPGFDPDGPTIVLQLGGELANNLGYISQALTTIWDMEEQGVYPTLVIRHQNAGKWTNGDRDIHKCFPWLAQFSFSAGNAPEVTEIITSQNVSKSMNFKDHNVTEFLRMYNDSRQKQAGSDRVLGYINQPVLFISDMLIPGKDSLPFSKYYHKLQHALQFNTRSSRCCANHPEPDEIAFHFRDFRTEMPRQWRSRGFWEAGPNRTAVDLLLPLITQQNGSNDKKISIEAPIAPRRQVAITSRFGHLDASRAHQYVQALQTRGVDARVVSDKSRTGLQDFCFLMHANTLVGVTKSTFTRYAGFLDPYNNSSSSSSSHDIKKQQVILYSANRADKPRRYTLPTQNFKAAPEMERFRYTVLEDVTDWRRRRG